MRDYFSRFDEATPNQLGRKVEPNKNTGGAIPPPPRQEAPLVGDVRFGGALFFSSEALTTKVGGAPMSKESEIFMSRWFPQGLRNSGAR